MSTDPTTPSGALDSLRAALTQLRALAALPSADPIYAHSAEQVAAIMTALERQKGANLLPDPPNPGAAPSILDPVPPNPG